MPVLDARLARMEVLPQADPLPLAHARVWLVSISAQPTACRALLVVPVLPAALLQLRANALSTPTEVMIILHVYLAPQILSRLLGPKPSLIVRAQPTHTGPMPVLDARLAQMGAPPMVLVKLRFRTVRARLAFTLVPLRAWLALLTVRVLQTQSALNLACAK